MAGAAPKTPKEQEAEWSATATADNAAATAQKAAVSGMTHFVTSIHLSFSGAATKLATLKSDVNALGNFHVVNQRDIVFEHPVPMNEGELAEVSLAASGAGGNIGAVTFFGYSKKTSA